MRLTAAAILSCAVLSPAWGQSPPSTAPAGEAQPQLRFNPVTRPSDPVGVIHAAAVPGGCLLVVGAESRPPGNTSQGGAFVPGQGCPRAVQQQQQR